MSDHKAGHLVEPSAGLVSEFLNGGPAVIQERLEDVEPDLGGVVEVVVGVVHQEAFVELGDGVLTESGIQEFGHDLGPDAVMPGEPDDLGSSGAIGGGGR